MVLPGVLVGEPQRTEHQASKTMGRAQHLQQLWQEPGNPADAMLNTLLSYPQLGGDALTHCCPLWLLSLPDLTPPVAFCSFLQRPPQFFCSLAYLCRRPHLGTSLIMMILQGPENQASCVMLDAFAV